MASVEPPSRDTENLIQGNPAATIASQPSNAAIAAADTPMTGTQADQILAELKGIKQRLLWILILGGFFAARSFFFHY